MSRTTIVLGEDLQEKAKEYDVNVSAVCREAVESAVESAKEARRLGDKLELVEAWRSVRGDQEKVAFWGSPFHYREQPETWFYLTKGGAVALVDSDGELFVFESLDELEADGAEGYVLQAAAAALGEVVKPTELDI